jgi:hypothetical protein
MTPDEITVIENTVASAVETHVNGKIKAIHSMLERQNEVMESFRKNVDAHIERVEPVISAYEEEKRFKEGITTMGERVVWWGKVIGGIGIVALAIKYAIYSTLNL